MGEMAWIAVLTAAGALLAALTLTRMLGGIGGPEVRVIESSAPPVDRERLADDIARVDGIVRWLCAKERAGRDTPSPGLRDAQDYVAAAFAAFGLEPAGDAAVLWSEAGQEGLSRGESAAAPYLRPFRAKAVEFDRVPLEQPVPGECRLEVAGTGPFTLGEDFVPIAGAHGDGGPFGGVARGPLVFAGFGIDNEPSGYDDFAGVDVEGKVALVLGGEPAIEGSFEGAEVSAEASLWNKIDALGRHGAVGALVVRTEDESGRDVRMAFRSTRASWVPPTFDKVRAGMPTLEVSRAAAARVLGIDPGDLEAEIAASGAALGPDRHRVLAMASPLGASAEIQALTERRPELLYNVVGMLRGTAPSAPCIVVGAHLDHIGVGPRGRIAYGADDNASGVAALLCAAESLSTSRPEYSVLFCAFTGEEDGLLGSRSLSRRLPTDTGPVMAMVNLDMVGRGDTTGLAVLRGAPDGKRLQSMDRALESAARDPGHGIASLQLVHDADFFTRSDHYSFYEAGIPAVFLFEGWPHRIGVYHTWTDTPLTLDMEKVARTSRFLLSLLDRLHQEATSKD